MIVKGVIKVQEETKEEDSKREWKTEKQEGDEKEEEASRE